MASTKHPPQILVRSKDRLELFPVINPSSTDCPSIASKGGITLLEGESCTYHSFSTDGQQILLLRPTVGLCLLRDIHLNSNSNLPKWNASLQTPYFTNGNGTAIYPAVAYFSPLGNWIVTWERPIKPKDGSAPPNNLKVWHQQKCVLERFSKPLPKKMPRPSPNGGSLTGGEMYNGLQFTHDEQFLCLLVNNEIQWYSLGNLNSSDATLNIAFRLKCPDISSFTLPPPNVKDIPTPLDHSSCLSHYLVSTFVPEVKGKPARVSLHQIKLTPTESSNAYSMSDSCLVSKSFYQTEQATIQWSPHGNAALVLTQTTVDTSGESYYGSSALHLLLTSPKPSSIQINLPGKGGGVVHDVAWCPSTNPNQTPMFALLSGKMPAMGSLHYGTSGDASFIFGEAHRNVVSWSPHGRFLCLAGFGNLAGGMDFWDKNKMKKMPRFHSDDSAPLADGEVRAHCAVGYGWSPDSRTFFVSTTSPRMNVDNAIRIFKYNGYGPFDQYQSAVAWQNSNYHPNKLLNVEFVPSMKASDNDEYPDRAQSPPPKKRTDGTTPNSLRPSHISSSSNSSSQTPSTPVGRYIPPSARAKSGGGLSLADRMRRDREGNTAQAGKVTSSRPLSAAFASKKSSLPVGMAPPPSAMEKKSKNAMRREKQRLNKLKQKEEEELALKEQKQKEEEAAKAAAAAPVDPAKRAKKISKLLKQIDALKSKPLGDLNDDQRKKLEAEEGLRKELASLAL